MDYLKSKSSLGNIFLVKENEADEVFSIGEGRLSLTPKEDFYLINFWVRAEYEIEVEEQLILVWGPTVEIMTKTNKNLLKTNSLKLEIPNQEEAEAEWEENYYTHFYHQIHQSFEDSKMEISRAQENLYSIEFSGIPYDDSRFYTVKGICKLELKNELKKYW